MGYPTAPAGTGEMPLEAVIARLAAHPQAEGILLMGTTGTSALVQTWIDGRLTEVYCTPVPALERIVVGSTSWPDYSEEGAIVRWLRDGRIAHDRTGRLRLAQERACAAPPPPPANEREVYGAWRSIGYNVAQTRRYLASDDPEALEAVDWRLLHGLAEVQGRYFTVRRLPWRGEKAAIHHLAEHDPDFLALLRRCLAEPDRRRKVAQYEELARHALAPVGGLWAVGMTVVAPGPGFGAAPDAEANGTAATALAFWQEMIGV